MDAHQLNELVQALTAMKLAAEDKVPMGEARNALEKALHTLDTDPDPRVEDLVREVRAILPALHGGYEVEGLSYRCERVLRLTDLFVQDMLGRSAR